jgi:hypothetical protein
MPEFHERCVVTVIYFPDNYTVSSVKKSWKDAREACLALDMDLASLETVTEFEAVKGKIDAAGKTI